MLFDLTTAYLTICLLCARLRRYRERNLSLFIHQGHGKAVLNLTAAIFSMLSWEPHKTIKLMNCRARKKIRHLRNQGTKRIQKTKSCPRKKAYQATNRKHSLEIFKSSGNWKRLAVV